MSKTRRTVFRNGSVFDGHRHLPGWGVVVADGEVVVVAPEAEMDEYDGPAAEAVDLAGGLVLPGFQDAHIHPVQGGLERTRCDLSETSTRDECLQVIRTYADRREERGWVCGGGWSMSAFGPGGPTTADLDAVVPGRPVFLPSRDHHSAWVSSTALQIAGVDRTTPDPVDGRLERDAAGNPSGTLHEGAMSLVEQHIPATSDDEHYEAFLVAQRYLHSLGVTTWQDAILGEYAGCADPSSTYLRAAESGDLTARVRGALWWERGRGAEQITGLLERRDRLTGGRLSAGAVKVMQDGIVENYTAAMTSPYLDGSGCATANTGLSFVDPVALCEHVTRLDAVGFQVHVHAIGDRAVREALDAIEAACGANGAGDNRHHIAHLQVIHPDDRARFAALGVSATMQPLWAQADEQMADLTMPYLDPNLAGWQYPFADLARNGARLAAGSDWPVSTPNPLLGIHVAVNRSAYDDRGGRVTEPFLPDQALTCEQAFAAYTSGSAYVNHLDGTGTLAPGMAADVVVLDRDPFAADPREIGAASVVATYVDARPVFSA